MRWVVNGDILGTGQCLHEKEAFCMGKSCEFSSVTTVLHCQPNDCLLGRRSNKYMIAFHVHFDSLLYSYSYLSLLLLQISVIYAIILLVSD